MNPAVLIIGSGDAGFRIGSELLRTGKVGRLIFSDISADRVAADIAMLDCCHDAEVGFEQADALDSRALENLFRNIRPDLIVQAASLISPWSIIGKPHPVARAIGAAGIGLQLPAQLPVVMNVMQVIRELGVDVPVANLSMPDIIHPILATQDLAPTIGLGNVSILHLRVAAALKRQRGIVPGEDDDGLEQIAVEQNAVKQNVVKHDDVQHEIADPDSQVRVIGHHRQVYDVMQGSPPVNPQDRVRVYVGEHGRRCDQLAYQGYAFAPGPVYNVITAASAVPVISGLLPGAALTRFSAPAPMGLPGGYPVRIQGQRVSLDLPAGVQLEDARIYNERLGTLDGVAQIESDGRVRFTESARAAVADIDPALAEPVDPMKLEDRARRLCDLVKSLT